MRAFRSSDPSGRKSPSGRSSKRRPSRFSPGVNFGLSFGSRPAAEVLQDYYVIRILPLLAAIVVGESGATVTVCVCVCVRACDCGKTAHPCLYVCVFVSVCKQIEKSLNL